MLPEPMNQESVTRLLNSNGIQPTQQRVLIGLVMFEKPQHLSAEQVMEKVNSTEFKDVRTNVSKATVYNTLGLFAQKGIINEVIVDPSRVFYDSNTRSHHHFYNIDTGELTDIEPGHIELSQLPDLPEGTVEAGVEVIVRVRSNAQA